MDKDHLHQNGKHPHASQRNRHVPFIYIYCTHTHTQQFTIQMFNQSGLKSADQNVMHTSKQEWIMTADQLQFQCNISLEPPCTYTYWFILCYCRKRLLTPVMEKYTVTETSGKKTQITSVINIIICFVIHYDFCIQTVQILQTHFYRHSIQITTLSKCFTSM